MEPTPADPEKTFSALPAGDPAASRPDEVIPPPTELESIVGELVDRLAGETTLPIPGRPGWEAVYDIDVDHTLMGRWRRNCKDSDQADDVDELKLACTILAAQNVRLVRGGSVIALDGRPVTFRDPSFQRLLGTHTANEAVRKAYGRDAHVVVGSGSVLKAAGYTDEQREDPTPSS